MPSNIHRKGGRKGRKIGKGIIKASHSKWGSYAGIMAHSTAEKRKRMEASFCKICNIQFPSRNVLVRHNRRSHGPHQG